MLETPEPIDRNPEPPAIPAEGVPAKPALRPLRLLIVEDSIDDADLLLRVVSRAGFAVTSEVVETEAAMRGALRRQEWDIITSDHSMPRFSAPAAIAVARELGPGVPLIIVSGEIDIELAVTLMREGSCDFVQKNSLARLVPAIERALREVEQHRERRHAEHRLALSETRYRRLFESAQDGILILDPASGQILDVNPYLTDMLGYSSDEVLARKIWDICAISNVGAAQDAFAELQREHYIRYDNLPLETKGGRSIPVEVVSNVYLVDGETVIQCNIRDMSVRAHSENELLELNIVLEHRVRERTAQLKGLVQELETFNYSVSHDLHAPLRHIDGFATHLQEDYVGQLDAGGMRLVQRIRTSVERMNALIDALMELARVARQGMRRRPVDLTALVKEIAVELQSNSPARTAEFTVAEGLVASGDLPLLRIVLENLLTNAWKFTARKDIARIEFGATVQGDGCTAYFVRDNGAGFDMTYAGRLFTPFQRLHGENEFPGTGIGLATVQRIIHRFEGRVWAEGAVDQGATVYFTL